MRKFDEAPFRHALEEHLAGTFWSITSDDMLLVLRWDSDWGDVPWLYVGAYWYDGCCSFPRQADAGGQFTVCPICKSRKENLYRTVRFAVATRKQLQLLGADALPIFQAIGQWLKRTPPWMLEKEATEVRINNLREPCLTLLDEQIRKAEPAADDEWTAWTSPTWEEP